MIHFQRTACVKSGVLPQALGVAREFAASAERIAGVDLQVTTPVGGNPWRIRWQMQFPDLNTMDKAFAAMFADPGYVALLGKIGEYLISGASVDEIWREM